MSQFMTIAFFILLLAACGKDSGKNSNDLRSQSQFFQGTTSYWDELKKKTSCTVGAKPYRMNDLTFLTSSGQLNRNTQSGIVSGNLQAGSHPGRPSFGTFYKESDGKDLIFVQGIPTETGGMVYNVTLSMCTLYDYIEGELVGPNSKLKNFSFSMTGNYREGRLDFNNIKNDSLFIPFRYLHKIVNEDDDRFNPIWK